MVPNSHLDLVADGRMELPQRRHGRLTQRDSRRCPAAELPQTDPYVHPALVISMQQSVPDEFVYQTRRRGGRQIRPCGDIADRGCLGVVIEDIEDSQCPFEHTFARCGPGHHVTALASEHTEGVPARTAASTASTLLTFPCLLSLQWDDDRIGRHGSESMTRKCSRLSSFCTPKPWGGWTVRPRRRERLCPHRIAATAGGPDPTRDRRTQAVMNHQRGSQHPAHGRVGRQTSISE